METNLELPRNTSISPPGLKIRKGRRKHKNSKFGCSKCKARKIKCDETLPACLNCDRKSLRCPYLTMTPYQVFLVMKSTNSSIDSSFMNKRINSDVFNEYPNHYAIDLTKNQSPDITNDHKSIISSKESLQLNDFNAAKIDFDSLNINESIYKATEMEHLLLPLRGQKVGNDTNITDNSLKVLNEKNANNSSAPKAERSKSPSYLNEQFINDDHSSRLSSSTKIVFKTFTINRDMDYEAEMENLRNFDNAKETIFSSDPAKIIRKYKGVNIDAILRRGFDRTFMVQSQFSKLISNSLLLHACDYIKNIILKQPILPNDFYNIKLRIAGACEVLSVNFNNKITTLIKNEYLKAYPFSDVGLVEIIIGCFSILNQCLVFHFKSGFKSELSIEESQNSVSKFGTFNAGVFSFAMDKDPMLQGFRAVRVIASYLGLNLKSILIPSLKPDLLEELKRRVEKLSTKISNEGYTLTHYENLRRFLEINTPLVREKMANSTTLLGVGNDSAYVIRLMNEFFQILPYDLFNLTPGPHVNDEIIVTYLSFIGTAFLLNNIIPGSVFFATNRFTSRSLEFQLSTNNANLLKLFKQITKVEFKETAIYLIRMIVILKQRENEYNTFFNTKEVGELTNPNLNMDLFERCRRLKQLKAEGIMNEILIKSFRLDKATFLQKWNVPHDPKSPISEVRTKEVKINTLLPTLEDKVNDFVLSNNGLFTNDYVLIPFFVRNEKVGAIAVDGEQLLPDNISMGWRVSTHIRTNNV